MTQSQRIAVYTRHIDRLNARRARLEAFSNRYATWRFLVLGGGGLLSLILLFSPYSLAFALSVLITLVVFVSLVLLHRRVEHSLRRHTIWRDIKREQQARLRLDWAHIPDVMLKVKPHPLEVDLDLRALHRLLNTAESAEGQKRLREWLLPIEPRLQHSEQRQALVRELAPRQTFRSKLILQARLSSEYLRRGLRVDMLHDWLRRTVPLERVRASLLMLGLLAGLHAVLFVLAQIGLLPVNVAAFVWALYLLVYLSRARLVMTLTQDSEQLSAILDRLQAIMQHLESASYQETPHLRDLCQPLLRERPSQHFRRIQRTLAAASLRGNPLLWGALNAFVPWDLFFLQRLHTQKRALAESLPQWLHIWHEIEALGSLATYAQLNPEATFPVLHDDPQRAVFRAVNIGHPLIPAETRVCNDFAFETLGEMRIITGSNMSGKSSFLRTLGVNLALAYAGGPALADALETRPFRVFSSIRVTDSLDDGISYFYAEVQRLKALLDALREQHPLPLFFVIDEIFRGTNNRERLIGSRAYLQALVNGNGVGLIATHDLELTQLAEGNPAMRNEHFREHIENGRMVFDYKLHPGPCPTTNALHIMALEGLPVEGA